MKDRRGFTLIEIIAVIVILGLVILIAVPFFQNSINVFRDDYYSSLESSIINSSKEFFSDNKIFLPNRYLDTQIIHYDALINEKYIEEIKDYNGNQCDLSKSYAIVVKTGIDTYEYATCTKCSEDDYDFTDSIYCSEAWSNGKGFTEVVFDAPPDVYIYKGTSREQLKEQVVVYPDIRRCLGVGTCQKEIKRVNAKGDVNAQPIYPINLDSVDTNTVGTYNVTYRYTMQDVGADGSIVEKTGRVIVYEYGEPNVVFTKYNTVYNEDLDSNTMVDKKTHEVSSAYNPTNENDWAQKLNIKFNNNQNVNGKKVLVARYQWFIRNRWEDFCVPNRQTNVENNECSYTIGRVSGGFELNDNIRFRYIDVEGKVSEEFTYKLRIDYTAPDVCTLTTEGTYGNRTEEAKTWYISNRVKVLFDSKDDATTTSYQGGNVKSGVKDYIVTTSKMTNKHDDYQSQDTTGVRWYGYVVDKAGNFTVCSVDFKKDSTVPYCTKRGDNTTWKNTKVTVYWGCGDDTSTCYSTEQHQDFNTADTYYSTWDAPSYDIYDKAGNHTACPVVTRNVYFDKKVPTCPNTQNSTWTNKTVTISWGCADGTGQSGCDPNASGGSKTFSSTQKTYNVSAYTIKDNAGNSTACPAYTSDVYVDTDKPKCDTDKSNRYSTSGVSVTVSCSDEGGSKVKTCPNGGSGHTSTQTYTVEDNAGNKNTCKAEVYSQAQARTKSCSAGDTCEAAGCVTRASCKCRGYTYSGECSCTQGSGTIGRSCTASTCAATCRAANPGYYSAGGSCSSSCTGWYSDSTCDCTGYDSSISKCGCASWGDYGGWSNVSSCSAGESSDHGTTTDCQTLYY